MSARSWSGICALLAVSFALALGCKKEPPSATQVTLAVAASLRHVMPELVKVYAEKHPGIRVSATYGASGDLRKQVEGGAPLDAVIFASGKPVDDLIRAGRADAASRKVLATNQLVLIGPRGSRPLTFATLETLPDKEKIAIGDPGAVPAGQYAREYLQKIGKWSALQGRTVLGGDVSAVLAYARRGEVAAAIVYKTEVRGIKDVVVFDSAGADAPRIETVGAVVSGASAAREAGAFLTFVASPEGQSILADHGFGPP
jgi:molybdate transport system substrate-binding protein